MLIPPFYFVIEPCSMIQTRNASLLSYLLVSGAHCAWSMVGKVAQISDFFGGIQPFPAPKNMMNLSVSIVSALFRTHLGQKSRFCHKISLKYQRNAILFLSDTNTPLFNLRVNDVTVSLQFYSYIIIELSLIHK